MAEGERWKPYTQRQGQLLPAFVEDALDPSDPVFFITDVVDRLDLAPLAERYAVLGEHAYGPRRLLKVWRYGATQGVYSGRELARRLRRPDAQMMPTGDGALTYAYNAQAAVSADGMIVASGLTTAVRDIGQLGPLVAAIAATTGECCLLGVGREGKAPTRWPQGRETPRLHRVLRPPVGGARAVCAPQDPGRASPCRDHGRDGVSAFRAARRGAGARRVGPRLRGLRSPAAVCPPPYWRVTAHCTTAAASWAPSCGRTIPCSPVPLLPRQLCWPRHAGRARTQRLTRGPVPTRDTSLGSRS